MIEEPPKLTISRSFPRPSTAQVAALQGVPTGFVVDAMGGGGGALTSTIKPLELGGASRVAGPAVTAGNGPGDILATMAALAFLKPGDVLIATAQGFQGCAAGGDSLAGMARNRGALAMVSDGPVRDLEGLRRVGLPVWCTGLTPATPHMTGPGTVGLPVEIGGRQIASGDMIVADADGVVAIPLAQLDAVIARIAEVARLEAARDAAVADGLKMPEAVAQLLESDAVDYLD